MEEFIDIVTKEGKPTGQSASKYDIHSHGYYHNTAHVWLYTKSGQILLAQRAASKAICPLLWDVSVAGHIDAGEPIRSAAVREVNEEIGLTISENDLELIGIFESFQSYETGVIDNEFHHTFMAELKVEIIDLNLQKEEVEAVKLVSLKDFNNIIEHIGQDNHFVAHNKKYYEIVLAALTAKINSIK